jgi:nitroreductase
VVAVLTESLAQHLALLATRAPSLHNSQPWRLVVTKDGLDVRADRERQLGVIDPMGRQLLMSCGSLVHHLVVAGVALGLEAAVTLLPEGDDPDLVARIRLTSVADPPSLEDVQHAEAILHRATNRTRYAEGGLSEGALELLRQAVQRQGVMLTQPREEDRITLDVLVEHAERELLADEAYHHELEHWVFDPERDGERPDGIPVRAVEPGPDRAEEIPGRRFLPEREVAVPVPRDPEHPALLLLTTSTDEPGDWVRAGMGLSALLLEGTELGLAAQPLGQVTDVAHERMRLRRDLHLVGVPQMLLRVGRARVEQGLQTPRRPLETVLTWESAPSAP